MDSAGLNQGDKGSTTSGHEADKIADSADAETSTIDCAPGCSEGVTGNITDSEANTDSTIEGKEARHITILGGDLSSSSVASVSLHRCSLRDCCDNKVHCPFCDVRQYKPAQPARVRDHLHLTHFQHAVYYDGLMVVKCFHTCRGSDTKGGHYHCPVCSTTLLKRNAFTNHLHSHAARQGLKTSAVQAPDAKRPAVIYHDDLKIELCQYRCPNTLEPHFHCPLCQQNCEQLSVLTAHLWRCKRRAFSMAAKADSRGYSLNVAKLFLPDLVQSIPHLKDLKEFKDFIYVYRICAGCEAAVRNFNPSWDKSTDECKQTDCCKGRYHCPLCTTSKLKPNHLCHMKQHFVSHWRSGVKFKEYTVLVCYLPCELAQGVDRIRFHYHCPLCGATRRRREGFTRHLGICDPSRPKPGGQGAEMAEEAEEDSDGEGERMQLEPLSVPGNSLVPLSDSDTWPSCLTPHPLTSAQSAVSRRASADQAELQAAQSLADMDHRILMESLHKKTFPSSAVPYSAHQTFDDVPQNSSTQPCGVAAMDKPEPGSYSVSHVQSHQQNAVSDKTHILSSHTQALKHNVQSSQSSTTEEEAAQMSQSVQETLSKSVDHATKQVALAQSNTDQKTGHESSDNNSKSIDNVSIENPSNCSTLNSQSGNDTANSSGSHVTVDLPHKQDCPTCCNDGRDVCNEPTKSDQISVETTDKSERLGSNMADNVQIFQQVTTNISDSIVSELQRRGDLEKSLEAIGQVCKVAWQCSGAMVTMTCDLEELCHVQNCLKMILKEGVQHFINSPPARPSASTANHTPSPPSQPPSPTTPTTMAVKPGRKRGRPRGSKKKPSLAKEEIEADHNGSKKTNTYNAQCEALVPTHQDKVENQTSMLAVDVCMEESSTAKESSSTVRPQNNSTETYGGVNSGRYTGRTRGKRINFALLNAGNISPPHKDPMSETTPPPPSSSPTPATLKTGKRGRGRPRKTPLASLGSSMLQEELQMVQTELQVNTGKESAHEASSQNSTSKNKGDGMERICKGENEEILKEGGISSELLSVNDVCDSVVSINKTSADSRSTSDLQTISVLDSCTKESSVQTRGTAQSTISLHNPQIIGNECGKVSENLRRKEPQNIHNLTSPKALNSSSTDPSSISNIELQNEQNKKPQIAHSVDSWKKNSTQPQNNEELIPDIPEEQAARARSPVIAGRKTVMYRSRRGATDFAIIPNIIFDFTDDGQAEDVEHSQPSLEDLSAELSCEVSDDGPSTAVQVESEGADVDGEGNEGTHAGAGSVPAPSKEQKLLRCPMCKSTHSDYSVLSTHISSLHPDKAPVTCDLCEVVYPTPAALTLHLECRHGPRPQQPTSVSYKCKTCNKQCISSAALRWHRSLVHKEVGSYSRARPRLKCAACNYTAVDSWDMRHHREQHRVQSATCPICQKSLSTEAALKVHMAAKHSSDTFTCHICNKTFAHMRYLRSHLQRHGGEKRHVCTICGWRFYQTNTLRAHMDTHKPRTQRRYAFRCPHCPAAYNSQANYKDHLNKHTGERPYLCNQCGRGFAFRSMLTTHVAFKHSSSRPHCCTECNKRYKTKAQLKQHQMTHTMARTGISPFMCSKCNRPMASKSRLHAHLKRCKGGNFSNGVKQVVWRQRVMAPGQESKLQTVDIMSHQPVNLQVPLVDLFPGQHINVVSHGFSNEATITIVPVQSDATQGTTVLVTDDHKSLLTPQGTLNSSKDLKQEEMDSKGEISSLSSDVMSSVASQEQVLIQNSVSPACNSSIDSTKSAVSDRNVSVLNTGDQQTVFLQSGDAVSLLSNETISKLHASYSSVVNQVNKNSSPLPNLHENVLHEKSQSESVLQATTSSQQLVLSDRFGHTQTLLLPPDFIKQEVVMIENEDGHQNVLDLSKVQIVHTDSVIGHPNIQFVDGDQTQQIHVLQTSEDHDTQSTAQIGEPSCLNTASSSENCSLVQPSGEGEGMGVEGEGQGGELDTSVYMCSTCGQQFDSMASAQQHILLDHTLDVPMSTDLQTESVNPQQDPVAMDVSD